MTQTITTTAGIDTSKLKLDIALHSMLLADKSGGY